MAAQASLGDLAIDAVFVLSVKTFADRIAHVTGELGRFGIPFEFIFDFDAVELDAETIATHFVAGSSPPMTKQASLTLKHAQAWRLACARGARRIMVFEDDVVLFPQFPGRLAAAMRAADALPPGWLVFLGGADAKVPDAFFLHPDPLVPQPSTTAEGYVTDLDACRRRLSWLAANQIGLPADQLITHIDRAERIAQYWPPEPLVEQGSVIGLFDSVLDASRGKHSRVYNVVRHRWTKWCRRTLRRHWVRARQALRLAGPPPDRG